MLKKTGRVAMVAASLLVSGALAQGRGTVQAVQIGRVVEGRLSQAEVRHTLRLAAGQTVRITARGRDFDALIKVYGPTGAEPLAEDDDSGGGTVAELTFQAERAGVYQIAVSESVPRDAESGRATPGYDLTVVAATAPVIPPLRAITPNGEPTAVDMAQCGGGCRFTFQANAGDRLVAETATEAGDVDPVLELRMGTDKLAEDDDSGDGSNARIARPIQRTGTYTLLARTLGGGGKFTLAVSVRPHVPRPAAAVAVGTPVTGTITADAEMNDEGHFYDAYTLHGRAGQRVVIDLESTAFDAALQVVGDTVLGSVVLAANDDAETGTPGRARPQTLNSRLALTFEKEGTVEVRAASLGERGAYTLRVSEQPPR